MFVFACVILKLNPSFLDSVKAKQSQLFFFFYKNLLHSLLFSEQLSVKRFRNRCTRPNSLATRFRTACYAAASILGTKERRALRLY